MSGKLLAVSSRAANCGNIARFLLFPGLLTLLSACAMFPKDSAVPETTVMVVPSSADGHVGAVVVHPIDGSKPVVLNKAYVAADLGGGGNVQTVKVDPGNVNREFATVRAALPPTPATFLVLFVEGTDTLQPEAKRVMDQVAAEVDRRKAPEINVIGHTDFVGSDEYNDRLSLQRAEKVRDLLIKRGIPVSIIQVAGRGKREPVVATTAAEPLNRRVEITVR